MKDTNRKYDIIHFEALGPEAIHLEEEIKRAIERNEIPDQHAYLITPKNVQEYLRDNPATILPDIVSTKTHSVLPDQYILSGRKSVITRSAGYDHFEHLVDRVNIASLREYCVNAVAQTAMKFLYAAAGELNHYTVNAATFERKDSRAFVELDRHRTLTVFGVGKIGKRTHELAEANGLTVQGVDIRQDELAALYSGQVRFVPKEEAIVTSDIIINAMNLTRNKDSRFYNVGYFSKAYLSQAKKNLIFINVTRGEIAPESVIADLYRAGKITGIGLDVFSNESQFAALLNKQGNVTDPDVLAARGLVEKAIDRSSNIYVQPHQGFNSDIAAQAKAVEAIKHVAAWYKNGGSGFEEQLPYY
ncbi:MAG: hydroxyacid dehydrogenase [Deltaproteobacteria bacterium]|nr:hydroxyacid dehydrogenase [Deltaproteobacteria bacterium]